MGWTREEALLTLSLLFENPASDGVDQDQLLELGELIGRSPGSISFKVAGNRALRKGESTGRRRVSAVQRELFREYGSRPETLLRDSETLRAGLLERLPTARAEGERRCFPSIETLKLVADRCAFPWSACHPFEHGNGQVRGSAYSTSEVLASPLSAPRFFQELLRDPKGTIRRSEGFRRVEAGDLEGFAAGVLRWKFPTLHLDEIQGRGASNFRRVAVRPEIHRPTFRGS